MTRKYESIEALNWSSLKHLATSPRLYQRRLMRPEPQTEAMVFGSAVHCRILEPDLFAARYAVFEGVRRGKAWDAWREENPGVMTLKPDKWEAIEAVALAVAEHRDASRFLDGAATEQAIEWTDPDTGLKCKARLDAVGAVVVELKTCADPSPRVFAAQAARMLYHGQLDWYHHGAIAAGVLPPDAGMPVIIAAQSEDPYDVAPYQLAPEDLAAGRALAVELMGLLRACAETDYWPGVAPELMQLPLPAWARGAMEVI